MRENIRKYVYFRTHSGQYNFLYMTFGLSDCCLMFYKYIYDGFGDLINGKVFIIYMDDFLTPTENEGEGLRKLQSVLTTSSKYGLELNF